MAELQHKSFFERLRWLFSGLRLFLHRHRIASMIAGQVVIITVLVMFVLNSVFGINLFKAFAQISCSSGKTVYAVQSGDTLGTIATAYSTTWQALAQDNHIANPNLISVDQQICVPDLGTAGPPKGGPPHNTVNPFPYGQCTWWAAQRYKEVHGLFVPWTTDSDAWQWTARAMDFHWHVSSQPSIGAIVDLQPDVQEASSVGHVGVVEQILSNGDVVASNMNIVGHPSGTVVNLTFHPGSGVTFITA